jgi:hypothetical protein
MYCQTSDRSRCERVIIFDGGTLDNDDVAVPPFVDMVQSTCIHMLYLELVPSFIVGLQKRMNYERGQHPTELGVFSKVSLYTLMRTTSTYTAIGRCTT